MGAHITWSDNAIKESRLFTKNGGFAYAHAAIAAFGRL
jgi:hypothetical protein